jgi:hypothetical protein
MNVREDAVRLVSKRFNGVLIKVKENTPACTDKRAVYSVWVKPIGAKRGTAFCSLVYYPFGR